MSSQKRYLRLGFQLLLAGLFSGCLALAPTENNIAVYFNLATGNLQTRDGQLVYVYNPIFEVVTVYPLGEQSYTMDGDDAITARTRDGQPVTISVTLHYRLKREQILFLHQRWGDRFVDYLIIPLTRANMRDFVAQQSAESLYNTPLATTSADVLPLLSAALATESLTLIRAEVINIQFSEPFTQTMEARRIADQQLATAQAIAATAQAETRLTPTPTP